MTIDLQKFIWKLPITDTNSTSAEHFFKTFSTMIPDSTEIFVDVVDYQHTTDGPVTALIGHYADIVLDRTGGELGILYRQKKGLTGNLTERLATSLKTFLKHIDAEKFDANKSHLTVFTNDRALTPNTSETYDLLKEPLTNALKKIFPKSKLTLTPGDFNNGERLMVKISLS